MEKQNEEEIHRRYIIIILILLYSVFFQTITIQAEKVIKVAYCPLSNFFDKEENNTLTGYGVDYLDKIGEYTGWTYEYIEVQNWNDLWDLLYEKKADMILPVSYSENAANWISYSEYSIISTYHAIMTVQSRNDLYYEDREQLNHITIGMIKNSEFELQFQAYLEQIKATPTIQYFSEISEAEQALIEGKIDAIASNIMDMNNLYKVLERFVPEECYITVHSDNTELLEQLNIAMGQMTIEDPKFQTLLYDSYYAERFIIPFTKEEKDYIKQAPILKVGCCIRSYPMCEQLEDGSLIGVIPDILHMIEEKSGLKFELVPITELNTFLSQQNKEKKIDIVAGVEESSYIKPEKEIRLSQSYLTYHKVLVCPKEQIVEKQDTFLLATLSKESLLQSRIYETFPNATLVEYNSLEDCIQAVNTGEAGALIENEYIVNYFIKEKQYEKLATFPAFNTDVRQCLSVIEEKKQSENYLLTILNKSITMLSQEEIDNSIMQHVLNYTDSSSITSILLKYKFQIVFSLTIVLSIFVLILLQLLKSKKEMQKVLDYDSICKCMSYERFKLEAEKLLKKQEEYVLVHLDIIRFRYINDIYGFDIGNKVLFTLVEEVKLLMQETGLVTRQSNDHFLILLPYKGKELLFGFLERLETNLQTRVEDICTFKISLRGGVYILMTSDTIELAIEKTIHVRANEDYFKVEKFVFYDSRIVKQIEEEKLIDTEMVHALEKKEFVVYYQPKYNIFTQSIVGAEALIRWQHPKKGLIPPGAFLPYFEKSGLIVDLDFFVFEEACKTIQKLINFGYYNIPISSNFSALHINDLTFIDKLCMITDSYDIPRNLLEIEITETTAIGNMELAEQQINLAKERGFGVSIDDFGSGYSSLGLLSKLNADELKLDRSFMLNSNNEKDQLIIGFAVSMAKELNMSVVCEGVENLEHIEIMKKAGSVIAQGYYFSKPISLTEFFNKVKQSDY